MQKISLSEKLSLFNDYWNPRVAGELNGQHIKLAKLKGEFVWHKHDNEDELFFVLEGTLIIEFRDKTIELNKNECLIVPRGVEHKPVAVNQVSVMLFEPATTVNTGDIKDKLTREELEWI